MEMTDHKAENNENPPSMLVGAGEQPVKAEPQVVQPNFQLVPNFPVLNSTGEIFIQTGIVATVDSKGLRDFTKLLGLIKKPVQIK